MNIIWLSANTLGYELLQTALSLPHHSISTVVTLADDAKTVMYDGVPAKRWYELDVDVKEIHDVNKEADVIKNLQPDLIVMCGWRQVLSSTVLSIPPNGVIGFHPTLLPIGRGPAPIINSILHGFTSSGVTIFYVSEGLDDGDIIGQESFILNEQDYASDVYQKVIDAGKKLIQQYLPQLINGTAPRIPQDESQATVFPKLPLSNNELDIEHETIEEMYRKIRALSTPYKGAYLKKNGKKLIIWKAEMSDK